MTRRRDIVPMTLTELHTLHPGALLGRLKQLRRCEESLACSDRDEATPGLIEFKQSEEWRQAYADVKRALEAHGHISNSSRPSKR